MTYDEAVRRLHNNFCRKYNDYSTECEGCPNSKNCYKDMSNIFDTQERTKRFEALIIASVEALKI